MGCHFLPGTNASDLRIFNYEQPFYNIFEQRRLKFCFGQRPDDLLQIQTINQRAWEKHQTYLNRLENFPLKKAAYYEQLMAARGVTGVRGLSEITGEDWSHIARLLKIQQLPESIKQFLIENQQPEIIKYFHLRRLLELVRLPDQYAQYMRFREMLEEIGFYSGAVMKKQLLI